MIDDVPERHVFRLNKLAFIENILEISVDFLRINADEFARYSRLIANADDEVSASPIVQVVGKRANGFERRFWSPCFFKLNSSRFHDFS